MDADEITPDSLPHILADSGLRKVLLAAMREGQGRHRLYGRVADTAWKCRASGPELDRLVDILVGEERDDYLYVLDWLVFHPAMQDQTLTRLLDQGRCINSLGHRAGPEHLLLRLAREHRFPEAILTLALHHYGPDPARKDDFLTFIEEHLDLGWLRRSLRVSDAADRIYSESRQAALKLVDEYERLRG